MSFRRHLPALVLGAVFTLGGQAFAQRAPIKPHVIVVKLAETSGSKPYAFEPSTIVAERGDTLRFVDGSNMMHNVHFTSAPRGAHLGSATTGPYLTSTGQAYTVVIDSRFTNGQYVLVCDPHQTLGMEATLTVGPAPVTVAAK